jgi:hypothetical protein
VKDPIVRLGRDGSSTRQKSWKNQYAFSTSNMSSISSSWQFEIDGQLRINLPSAEGKRSGRGSQSINAGWCNHILHSTKQTEKSPSLSWACTSDSSIGQKCLRGKPSRGPTPADDNRTPALNAAEKRLDLSTFSGGNSANMACAAMPKAVVCKPNCPQRRGKPAGKCTMGGWDPTTQKHAFLDAHLLARFSMTTWSLAGTAAAAF